MISLDQNTSQIKERNQKVGCPSRFSVSPPPFSLSFFRANCLRLSFLGCCFVFCVLCFVFVCSPLLSLHISNETMWRVALLPSLFLFSIFFCCVHQQTLMSNYTVDEGYSWVVPPPSGVVARPPYMKTPTILLSTYPSSGNTLIWKMWELARGIGAQAVFKELGFLTRDGLAFGGRPHGGKLDLLFDSKKPVDVGNRVKNMTREELQKWVRSASPQEPVIVKNHHPIIIARIPEFFQRRSILGVISTFRADVIESCSQRFIQYCKITNHEFHKTWYDICRKHKIPLVIYPYSDMMKNPFVVFRDMFDKFVPFENVSDSNIDFAIQHVATDHKSSSQQQRQAPLPPTNHAHPKTATSPTKKGSHGLDLELLGRIGVSVKQHKSQTNVRKEQTTK